MVLTFDNHSCIPSADRLPVDYVRSRFRAHHQAGRTAWVFMTTEFFFIDAM